MKPVHSGCASCLTPVVDKCAVAFRDKENAFDISGSIFREVVFEVANNGPRWKIAYPQRMTGLFRFSRRTSGRRGNTASAGIRAASA